MIDALWHSSQTLSIEATLLLHHQLGRQKKPALCNPFLRLRKKRRTHRDHEHDVSHSRICLREEERAKVSEGRTPLVSEQRSK